MNRTTECHAMAELMVLGTEGALEGEERRILEDHLRHCPNCRTAIKRLHVVQDWGSSLIGPAELCEDFRETTGRMLRAVNARNRDVTEDDGPLPEAAPPGLLDRLGAHFGAAPWWMVSGAFHALVIMLATLIGMVVLRSMDKDTVILTDLAKQKEPEKLEKPRERTIIPKPVEMEPTEIENEQQLIVTHEEVEIADHVETADDSDAADSHGENGISDVWLGGSGNVAAMGLGGGGGGAFGRPSGRGGRLRRAIAGGGSRATESALDKALEWLAKNQKPDGSWGDVLNEGAVWAQDGPVGVTGLALLAFLGAGHTEKVGKYSENVRRAVGWLIALQKENGALLHPAPAGDSRFKYGQAIAGMALAEASAMGRVAATREAAQKAIDHSVELQRGKGSEKFEWRYGGETPDTSINGWFVMQLKSAKVAGLDVNPAAFEGAIQFLNTRQSDPAPAHKRAKDGYDGGGHRYGYRGTSAMVNTTSMGLLCRLFTGVPPEKIRGAAGWLLDSNPPAWNAKLGHGFMGPWPMYYMYYTTLVQFQVGGELWKEWNEKLKKTLIENQRKDGAFDGSWDPLSNTEKKAGRVYTTALGAMCLEVYYRYLPMYRE